MRRKSCGESVPKKRGVWAGRADAESAPTAAAAAERLPHRADIGFSDGAFAENARGVYGAVEDGGRHAALIVVGVVGHHHADASGEAGVERVEGPRRLQTRDVRGRGASGQPTASMSSRAVSLSGMRRPMEPAAERKAAGTASPASTISVRGPGQYARARRRARSARALRSDRGRRRRPRARRRACRGRAPSGRKARRGLSQRARRPPSRTPSRSGMPPALLVSISRRPAGSLLPKSRYAYLPELSAFLFLPFQSCIVYHFAQHFETLF